jgi:PAS domain S-box-containing protein
LDKPDTPEKPDAEEQPKSDPPRQVNKMAIGIGLGMALILTLAVLFAFKFVEDEREREIQAWQVRLGIVADSRAAAVNDWVEGNFTVLRELAENASLQLYMTELSMSEGDKSEVTDEAAQAGYLRNLLVATADRAGFTPPVGAGEVAANVEKAGVAGLGLIDAKGLPIVSSPGMPPLTGKIRQALAIALDGEPATIDAFRGAGNLPTIGFALPVYGIQDDGEGSAGIGAIVGMRVMDEALFERLQQPGDITKTAETYIVRSKDATVEYVSPLADGTPPLKRSLASDTPDLAAPFVIEKPGGFAIKRDYAGERVLVASRPLATLPWVLARKISYEEALAETETRLKTILYVLVSIIIVVGVTIIAVWRHGSSIRATAAAEKSRVAAERFENMSKFMRLVTNSQPTEIVAVSDRTHYTFANDPAAKNTGITTAEMIGKTMASVIGPVKAQVYADINHDILTRFAESNDTEKERETQIRTFGEEGDPGFEVLRSDHIPLRGDRDHPPGVLMILDDITELTQEKRRSEKRLNQLISTIVGVVDRRDPYSADHAAHVAEVCKRIAEEMKLPEEDVKTVTIAGTLVYFGKIFLPPDLLTKTENLTPEERNQLTSCHLITADLLQGVTFEGPVVETIRLTGENWDGSGFLGLRENDILATARILSVANSFVGMVNPRAYREAMTFDKAISVLLEGCETKFDRKPVAALINYLENHGGREQWSHFRDKPETEA